VKEEVDAMTDVEPAAASAAAAATAPAPSSIPGADAVMSDTAAPTASTASPASAVAAPSPSSSKFLEADEFTPALDYAELDDFWASCRSVAIVDSKTEEESWPLLTSLFNGMRQMLNEHLMRPLGASNVHPATLRAVVILLENIELWSDPTHYDQLALLLRFIANLPRPAKKLLVSWFSDVERWSPGTPVQLSARRQRLMYSTERLERLLGTLNQFISVRIFDKRDLRDVVPAVVVISLINEANEGFARLYRSIPLDVPRSAKAPVPLDFQLFYNDAVNEVADLKSDFRRWMSQQAGHLGPNDFSFSKYNFVRDMRRAGE
jgi:hypothetical protein